MSNLPEDVKLDILENEEDLLENLLAAANFTEDEGLWKQMRVKRNGRVYFTFRIRPLSEEEAKMIRRNNTRYLDNPRGANLPKIPGEVNEEQLVHEIIYRATVDEDRKRIWDNPAFKANKSIITGMDAVGLLLLPGEIEFVHETISAISGYGKAAESAMIDDAKN